MINLTKAIRTLGVMRVNEFKKEIKEKGYIVSDHILNLNAILNHQVNPKQIMDLGQRFAALFAKEGVTKVVTVEASGISVGFATALEIGVPLIFARRRKTVTTDADSIVERVPSFTHGIVTDVIVTRSLLSSDDRVLIIDDIMANGDAVRGLVKIVEQSGAALTGIGIVIEKTFQAGGKTLRDQGIRVESLVKIASLSEGNITFE